MGLLIGLSGCSSGDARAGGPAGQGTRAVPVAIATAVRHDLARTVTVTGSVEPVRTVGVISQAAGTIVDVRVLEGHRVTEGQLLARLDGRETAAQLARAEAVLASAERSFERTRQLNDSGIVTDAEFEQARSAYDVAQSDVSLWRTRVGFTELRAPTAGVVTGKFIEEGTAVAPNQRVLEIADDSLLVVRVQVSELEVVQLNAGSRVDVRLDAYPDARLPGTIRRIFPSADPVTRLVPVEVALGRAAAGVEVRPGFLARITLAVDRRRAVLAVPTAAIGVDATTSFVYVVDADTLVRRTVRTGANADGLVEVADGLTDGEQVVISGYTNLRPGMTVRVSEDHP